MSRKRACFCIPLFVLTVALTLSLSPFAFAADINTPPGVPLPEWGVAGDLASAGQSHYYCAKVAVGQQLYVTVRSSAPVKALIWDAAHVGVGDPLQVWGPGLAHEIVYNAEPAPRQLVLQLCATDMGTEYGLSGAVKWSPALVERAPAAGIRLGAPAFVAGTLVSAGAPAGVPLWLEARTLHSDWSTVAQASIGAGGTYNFRVSPPVRTWYRVRVTGNATTGVTLGREWSVFPAAKLATPVLPSVLRRSRTYALSGGFWPRHTPGSRLVRLRGEHYERRHWVKRMDRWISVRNSGSASRYVATLRLSRGKWRFRTFHASAEHRPTYSGFRTVTVR